jgi:hypothetical protein
MQGIARIRGRRRRKIPFLTGHTTRYRLRLGCRFEIRFENDAMYGRGNVDMKGALAGMAVSMAAIRRAGITFRASSVRRSHRRGKQSREGGH